MVELGCRNAVAEKSKCVILGFDPSIFLLRRKRGDTRVKPEYDGTVTKSLI